MATIDDLRRAAAAMPASARAAAARVNTAAAARTAEAMRSRLHSRTGNLANAIRIRVDAAKLAIAVEDIPGRTPAAVFSLEFGSVNMGARPFIRPAQEAARATIAREQEQAVRTALLELFA